MLITRIPTHTQMAQSDVITGWMKHAAHRSPGGLFKSTGRGVLVIKHRNASITTFELTLRACDVAFLHFRGNEYFLEQSNMLHYNIIFSL